MTLAERLAKEAVGFEGSPVLEEIVTEAINKALDEAAKVARENRSFADGLSFVGLSIPGRIADAIEALKTEQEKEIVHGS